MQAEELERQLREERYNVAVKEEQIETLEKEHKLRLKVATEKLI